MTSETLRELILELRAEMGINTKKIATISQIIRLADMIHKEILLLEEKTKNRSIFSLSQDWMI